MLSHSASLLLALENTWTMTWWTWTSPTPGTMLRSWPSPQTTKEGMVTKLWIISRQRWETQAGQISVVNIGSRKVKTISSEEDNLQLSSLLALFEMHT